VAVKQPRTASDYVGAWHDRWIPGDQWARVRKPFAAVVIFSAVANLLLLTSPLFMLQIYDRVLTSHSVPTLVALTVLAAVLIGVFALLDLVRQRVMARKSLLQNQIWQGWQSVYRQAGPRTGLSLTKVLSKRTTGFRRLFCADVRQARCKEGRCD